MTTAYERAMTLTRTVEGVGHDRVGPKVAAGRGTFGGLLAAAILRSMTEDVADAERIARSLRHLAVTR